MIGQVELAQIAQALSATCWSLPIVLFSGSFARVVRGQGTTTDAFRTVHCFIAATQIGFVLRWYLYPHAVPLMRGDELSLWIVLYLTSSIEALALAWFAWLQRRHK